MVGPGEVRGQEDPTARRLAAEALASELDRLQSLIVQTMDLLAEQVLDQIQVTRGLATRTEAVASDLASATRSEPSHAQSDIHLRRVQTQIERALRELPESAWDQFAGICTQTARAIQRLSADG